MIPEKVTPMDKEYVDVTVSSIIALMGGWLLKSFFTPSRKEFDDLRLRQDHMVTTKSFDKEVNNIQARLDRIEDKIDKIIDK
jgi:hypothetical protein